jgi:hypothetical protein
MDLVKRSLSAITSTEVSKRKSLWVRGTFGTGKSHASAVVKHLLCDDYEDVKDYICTIQDVQLSQKLANMRAGGKRYFSVTLKGVEKAYDIPRFTLSLQRETQRAIQKIAPDFHVKSDFNTAIDWIKSHRRIFEEDVLAKDEDLNAIVDTVEDVIKRLELADASVYITVDKAVREKIGDVFQHASISEWLVEVEEEIEKRHIANGLIIFWDEFTSVMDTLKSDRINVLQNIAEKSQKHNLFLFLISHRVESQSQDTRSKDITKMSDRFDEIEYTMDTLSTYLIMRHSFIVNYENKPVYDKAMNQSINKMDDLFNFLCEYNSSESQYIKYLFPMHPYTAFLCSTVSNHIGSSNRSVIKFMHDESTGFAAFINDETNAEQGLLLTADSLWDFFYDDFDSDPASTSFTSIYKSFIGKVNAKGMDYARVFKAILLLNALALKFKGDIEKLTPDEPTLRYVFAGDRIEFKLSDILDFLNDSKIIVKNIFNQFKITGSSYNITEMNDAKTKASSNYSTSADILNSNSFAKAKIDSLFKIGVTIRREANVQYFSCEESEQLLRSKLNKFMVGYPNYLHIGLFLAINETNRDERISVIRQFSIECPNSILILIEETFSNDFFFKFIDAMATSQVAAHHFNTAESKELTKAAAEFVSKWVERMRNGSYTLFLNGKPINEGVVSQIPDLINKKISGQIFTSGFECVKAYSQSGAHNFFIDKNCPQTILNILSATNRDQLITHSGTQIAIKEIFSDNDGNSLITLVGELSENAKKSNAWLTQVCLHMDKCMDDAREKYTDRFNLSEILSSFMKPPFGFFTSFPNCAALAYAMRKHASDLFMPGISQPVSNEKLADMLLDLFKNWKEGRLDSNSKNWLRFGSPEESKLTDLLVDLFDLVKVDGVNVKDIKSLMNAKWGIEEFCKKVSKYPLWTLLYKPGLNEDLKKAINNIVEIFGNDSPSVDKIKALYKNLDSNRVELNALFTKASNYENGFIAFVESIEDVTIKKEWWNDMMDAVNTLQSEIAFRKESDVKDKIKSFFIRKIKGDKLQSYVKPVQPIPVIKEMPSIDFVQQARKKVQMTNMPNKMWQNVLLELIDKYPVAAEYIDKSLS